MDDELMIGVSLISSRGDRFHPGDIMRLDEHLESYGIRQFDDRVQYEQ